MIAKIKQAFEENFGEDPLLIKSPGRINLIGEHTDYNDGFVLPAAVDLGVYFACKQNNIDKYRFYSYDLQDVYVTDVANISKSEKRWANYLLGVIAQFKKAGKKVQGFDCVLGGDLPMGAGMSSSAAVETGLAYAINLMQGFRYQTLDLVKFSQLAEHEYAGVQCGIMDQFAVMHGKEQQVIKLDCRSLDYEMYPFRLENYELVLVNTGVKHSLAASAYNKRRQECETGVALLQQHLPRVKSLRDVTLDQMQAYEKEFDAVVYKRCSYVIEENLRLEKACQALETGDVEAFGMQMYGSHEGLREKYEVSCVELDQLVELAKSVEGVKGSRMMGGGFGGCTINLVHQNAMDDFESKIRAEYRTPDGQEPEIIRVHIDAGTHVVQ